MFLPRLISRRLPLLGGILPNKALLAFFSPNQARPALVRFNSSGLDFGPLSKVNEAAIVNEEGDEFSSLLDVVRGRQASQYDYSGSDELFDSSSSARDTGKPTIKKAPDFEKVLL
jgi:hypothetical protein